MLTTGEKLGPYEILAPIGAGGMGQVYRARDSRLSRDVAVKVSPEQFNERFEREARSIASLNHTNVCHLYDVGPNYLVMELVEGETLRGPMGFAEALPIIRQLIDGIEAAHDRNIVHRDLKPANIKITPEGVVKILDFGLAKAMTPEPEGTSDNSPTVTMGATTAGTILGTAAHMAPEQAKGKTADKRSDIWSFGVVVYELLSGKKPFDGESVVETLGAVINKEPDWSAVPERTQRLLRWCLEKDRKQRLQSIGDARRILEEVPETPAAARAPQRSRLAWTAAGILAAALAVLAFVHFHQAPEAPHQLVRLVVDLGSDVSLPTREYVSHTVIVSPQGDRLAYVSGSEQKLFTRRLDQATATELAGTERATAPFFSPDGQWVGFWVSPTVKKISVEGGAAVPVATPPGFTGGSWSEDGSILSGGPTGIVRVPAGGGSPANLMKIAKGELAVAAPVMLPGGKAALFTAFSTLDPDRGSLEVMDFANQRRKLLVPGGNFPAFLPSGHLIYTNRNVLYAVPFDPDKLEVRGTRIPVLDDIEQDGYGFGDFSVSLNGTLVYRRASGASSGLSTIDWLDGTGRRQQLLARPGAYSGPRFSPDGKRLAMLVRERSGQGVWVYDLDRETMNKLSVGGETLTGVAWSADGHYVVYGGLGTPLMEVRSDGSSQPQALFPKFNLPAPIPWSFTTDGKKLAFSDSFVNQIFTAPVQEQGGQLKADQAEQFLKTSFQDEYPAISADGRWLAYQSNSSGKFEIYVRPFPQPASGPGEQVEVSNNGGTQPVWNGHDLLYQSGDQIMAAGYTVKGNQFVPEKPHVWLEKLGGATGWDLEPRGKRVAVIAPAGASDAPKTEHEIVVLENFFDYLRQRVPVK